MTWTPSDTTDAIQSVVGLALSFANDGLLQFARGGSLMETVYQNCTTGRSNLFESHRQRRWLTVVSYLGLTPRERSSGNRRRLGAISKQGNVYLRMLLIHGGRTLLWSAHRKGAQPSALQKWGLRLHTLRGHNTATVALANKLARTVWAVWTQDTAYEADRRAA